MFVYRALQALPDEQRLVVVLTYFVGMTQSQVAEHLGVPLGTVKKRVRLAMRKLRLALERDHVEPTHVRTVNDE